MTKNTKKKGKGRPKSAPTRRIIKGKGDYKTVLNNLTTKMDGLLKKIPKGSFSRGGGAVGNFMGGAMGAAFGKRLGGGLSAITGYGDYQVRSNSLATVSTSVDMVPQFARTDHSVRVCHREFVGDLKVPTSPDDFNNNIVELINPANPVLFPWLNKMALLYTQYKIHGMVITYKTMSSNYSASGGPLGTVIIATNYNVNDQAFVTKVQMENSEFAVSCNPSTSLIHAIECDPKVSGLQTLYISDPGTQLPGAISDPRFYHYGKLQIATSGLPGTPNSTMGELWISYDIELMKPVIGTASVAPIPSPTFLGQVVNSNPNGTTLAQTGSRLVKSVMTRTYVNATGLTDLFYFPSGDTFTLGDTGMWYDPVTNVNGVVQLVLRGNDTNLDVYRPGRYRLTMYGTVSTALVDNSASVPIAASSFYTAACTAVGTGLQYSVVQATPNYTPPHYGRTGDVQTFAPNAAYVGSPALYRATQYTVTFILTVSGTNTTTNTSNRIQVLLPRFSIVPTQAHIKANVANLEVEWLDTETLQVQSEPA